MMQLLQGDCLELMHQIPDGSVDMVLCDLPYGTTACKWDSVIPFEPLWEHYRRLIKPRGAIVLFGSQPFTSALVMSNPAWFRYELIWHKARASGHLDANRRPLKAHENVCVFCQFQPTYNPQKENGDPYSIKGKRATHEVYGDAPRSEVDKQYSGERFPRSVAYFSQGANWRDRYHPTQKPVDLLAYLIRTYTNEGETVLDNTMGSGSTGVACVQTGREFIGIEQDAGYFQIAQRRIMATPRQFELAI